MHDDPAKVKAFFKDRVQKDVKANTPRKARDRADLQALQFYRGGEDNQWTVWDPQAQNYVPRPTGGGDDAALPEWFFKATSNHYATKIDGICSILNQSQPAQEITPERDEDKDRAAAEVAEAALPVLYAEAGYEAVRPQINKLVTLTNGVAVHVYYDTDDRWGTEGMPVLQCRNPDCQQLFEPHEVDEDEPCPECGATAGPTGGPATDFATWPAGHPQAGQPMMTDEPTGKICMRVLTSFEWSVPRSARELHEERVGWIAGHGRMDRNEILALWDKARAKLGPDADKAEGVANMQSVAYADRMRSLSAPGVGDDRPSASPNNAQTGPVVWMVWADPVDDDDFYFPDGLYAVMLEDELVLENGPLPLKDDKGRPVKNVLLRSFQATPGSAWGKPPADDLVPLQKQFNLCLALGFLILMNDAAPTTYIPDTVTLLDDLSGQPGATVQFKSLRAGDKPIVQQGSGFPESLKWFIEFLVQQFDTVSKLNAVLQGARPEGGDPTLGEIQILQERGLAAFKEPLDELVSFEKRLSKILLWTARQSIWSSRFYTVAGDNGEWSVKSFLGADLDGNIAINVEPASAWPASQLLTNLRLDQAVSHGMIDPRDPEVQQTYLSLNDLTAFKKSTDEDRKQIARQIDAWKQATDPSQITPPDPLWNLPLHFFHKVMWLRTEESELMASHLPEIYQAVRAHITQIQQLMAPPAPPAPKPGDPGGPKPDGSAIDHAVKSGAIKPADPNGGKPTGQALDAAISSGAIHPAGTVAAMQTHAAVTGAGGLSLNDMLAQQRQRPATPKGARGPRVQAGTVAPPAPISGQVVG